MILNVNVLARAFATYNQKQSNFTLIVICQLLLNFLFFLTFHSAIILIYSYVLSKAFSHLFCTTHSTNQRTPTIWPHLIYFSISFFFFFFSFFFFFFSINTPGVIERVKNLFRGYNKLILGFNTFLPEGEGM